MNYWTQSSTRADIDVGVLEESALAMAQSTIQFAINESGLSRADLARRMQCDRSFVSRMLSGNHNLTVKTMARSLAACGFEVRFEPVRLHWNWINPPVNTIHEEPANAGSTKFAADDVAFLVALAL
jgi:transcriptional regulator with XRE-family HTH domain